jgi:hypothetical protein
MLVASLTVIYGILLPPSTYANDDTNVSVYMSSILTLNVHTPTTGGPDSFRAVAKVNDGFSSGFIDLELIANGEKGGSLSLSMAPSDPASGALYSPSHGSYGGDGSNLVTIGRLTGNGSSLGDNQWGFRFFDITSQVASEEAGDGYDINTDAISDSGSGASGAAGYWKPIPSHSTNGSGHIAIWDSSNFNSPGKKVIRGVFGVKITGALPPDKYGNSVLFTASTNN